MKDNYAKRVRALRERLTKERISALIVVTVEDSSKNVRYLSGFGGTTGALLIYRSGAILAVDARYTARARKEAKGVTVAPIPSSLRRSRDFAHYVETALSASGISKKARIAYEGARVPTLMAQAWGKRLKRKLIPVRGFVERLRQVKDANEVSMIAHAARVTSRVFETVAKKIRAGMRESDIAAMLDIELRKRGALKSSFDAIVASGPNSAIPHHETGNRKVRAGDPVVLDFGGVFPGGYCSDLTRTIFVKGKRPHPKLVEIYNIVLEANKRALRALKPGMKWRTYDAVARDYITEKGYGKYFTHGLGHSIGLEVHDPYDYEHDAFLPGTVLSNEPGVYIEGMGGVRIEDDVVVTKNAARRLTNASYRSL